MMPLVEAEAEAEAEGFDSADGRGGGGGGFGFTFDTAFNCEKRSVFRTLKKSCCYLMMHQDSKNNVEKPIIYPFLILQTAFYLIF